MQRLSLKRYFVKGVMIGSIKGPCARAGRP